MAFKSGWSFQKQKLIFDSLELTRENKFQTCFVLEPTVVGKYDLGFVTLKWRRKLSADGDAERIIPTTTQIIIPSVKVQQKFFSAKIGTSIIAY